MPNFCQLKCEQKGPKNINNMPSELTEKQYKKLQNSKKRQTKKFHK